MVRGEYSRPRRVGHAKRAWFWAISVLQKGAGSAAVQTVRQILPASVRSILHRFNKGLRGLPVQLILPRRENPPAPVRVVIYGSFADNWIPRFAATSTWRELVDVTEVLILPDPTGEEISPPLDPRSRTVVIPLSEDDIIRCPRAFPTLAPPSRAVETLRDKVSFAAYAEAVGLAAFCPTVYRSPEEVRFPCIVKPARAEYGVGIRVFRSSEQFASFLAEEGWNPKSQICQQFISGEVEYSTHCVLKDGRLLWSCSFACELLEGSEIRQGVTFRTMRNVTPPAGFLDAAERILAPLEYSGPCNFDYKVPAPGRIAIFEINPRFGGSLMLAGNLAHLQAALRCIIDSAA